MPHPASYCDSLCMPRQLCWQLLVLVVAFALTAALTFTTSGPSPFARLVFPAEEHGCNSAILDALELFLGDVPPIAKAVAVNAAHAARYGPQRVFPVSFSLPTPRWSRVAVPGSETVLAAGKLREWSTLIPGNKSTYTFWGSEEDYMRQYAESWKARTFRKGGVDCARHVEIIAAGAIPVFRGSQRIPDGTMVGYPVHLLRHIEAHADETDPAVLRLWAALLRRWGLRHLTCGAMVRYMAAAARLPAGIGAAPGSVLFVDETLPTTFNYLAAFTLIGLFEVYGAAAVHVLEPPRYLYADSWVAPGTLYGGGYGYARSLPAFAWRDLPPREVMLNRLNAGGYDLVIFGSVYRPQRGDEHLAEAVRAYRGRPERLWLCHGGDLPPSAAEYGPGGSLLSDVDPAWHESATLFVREWPFRS